MVETDRRRIRGDKARAGVLAHSARIASVEGLEGLTFGRLATEAGVAKGNIQVLFGDKEALQLATLESAVDMYRDEVVDPAMAQSRPGERLRALVAGWFRFVQDRRLPGGCFLTAVSSEFRSRPGAIRDRVNQHRNETRARFESLAAEAIAARELPAATDPARLAFDLLAYQAIANVAAAMDDEAQFAMARERSLECVSGK
ncbi:TetR/AcrR family transcriptional regulator [Achromobacter sp. Marseille-Q0513]|uniref:TetR/AcrR family transcriptional regulator n=1 Tax=Achromobacter sp. Marseille-Q0513 TaxID=2829161 RepID=UPI001B98E56A|nr:TetR/AcrR family transcriptional regulator [Achromobacter sp. Marseille-Q0513]MBR8656816.1 TetR/AcrR family transcriptional regulator [Achromobacter sp. Marseille-Q0513]